MSTERQSYVSPPLVVDALATRISHRRHVFVGSFVHSFHRATTLRLEQQLHKATKDSQLEPQVPRSWASVPAGQDHSAAAAAAPDAAAKCNTVQTNAKLPHRSEGRRASCPEANPSHAHQARRPSNQLPRGKELSTMRHALEGQQRAATMLMGSVGKVRFALWAPVPALQFTATRTIASPRRYYSCRHVALKASFPTPT